MIPHISPVSIDPEEFPTGALGGLLGQAVREHHANSQAPLEVIAPSAVISVAAVIQHFADVKIPNWKICPAAIFGCFIGTSTDGKDAGANIFMRPQREFQNAAQARRKNNEMNWKLKQKVWQQRVTRAVAAVALEVPESEEAIKLEGELCQLYSQRPTCPKSFELILDDVTVPAIKVSLCEKWPVGLVYSMEGSTFFNNGLGRNIGFFNSVYQGDAISRKRVGEPDLVAPSPRLSVLIGIQMEPMAKYLRTMGAEALESGFVPRFLFSCVPPTLRSAEIKPYPGSNSAMQMYSEKVTSLCLKAELYVSEGRPRDVVGFDPEASDYFIEMLNWYRRESDLGGPYACIRAHARRAPENIARIALVLHITDDLPGDMSVDTIRRAQAIGHWHVLHFLRLFSQTPSEAFAEANALHLLGIIQRRLGHGRWSIGEKDLMYEVPHGWKPHHLKVALRFLVARELIFRQQVGRREEFKLPVRSVFDLPFNPPFPLPALG